MTDNAPRRDRRPAIRTFVIADIRGWTRFTAEHGDEAAARLAKKFADVGGEGVEAWGGEVVELRGDELLAVFDSARDALRAAVELQAAFAAETLADPSLPLTVGIGIDAGEAVPLGDGYRGAALNVAARLCTLASGGESIASQKLVQLAGRLPEIDYVELESTSVKGLDEPVTPVRVITPPELAGVTVPRSTEAAPEAVDAGPLPADLDPIVPLAGRTSELRWLNWHWRRAGHGAGRAVVISGPPGIGKTRLAAEIATRVHAEGANVAYWPAGGLSNAPVELPNQGRALVVVDDLDAAQPATARQVANLAANLVGQRVLLLVTHREEATPDLLSLVERSIPAGQRHTLGPLEPAAIRAIAALYAGPAVEKVPISEVLEQSGGVPAAVHRWSSAWARTSAAERLAVSADRTSADRHRLRSAEAELVGDVAQLERARERTDLYGADAADADAQLAARRAVCPYKGLAAFDADDAEYYFGRERLVAELIARLVGSSFLALVGASGSGKSSALRAGLLPALAGGVLPGSAQWRQVVIRPGEQPTAELERVLGSTLEEGLGQLSGGQRLVLVVDQFEEVFNSTRDEGERARFVELVTSEDERLKVVLAMRADHYGQCAAYTALARLLGTNQVLVGALTSEELRAVIEHPAQRVGLRVEAGLTDALLADLGDEPGALPLLSTALLELWQARESGRMTLAAYRTSGGVQGAVARLAESAYGALSAPEQDAARGVFLRLAGTGDGESVVRRRVALSEFDPSDALSAGVLHKLTNARLLTSGDGHVEVAHEALLREWPRIRAWLEEDAATRQLRLHLIGAARDWEARGREVGDLYRSARLAAALDWAAEHSNELNALEREFVEESRIASERDAERQRRTNRRLRVLLAGAGVFLLVAVAAGVFAAYQAQLAGQAEEFARSRELAASAIAARDDDPTLSKLLAIDAASIADPPVESVAALHRAIDSDRVIYRYEWPAGHEVGFLHADLDPSGRYIAASGGLIEFPHDYVEVVDREAAQGSERLWSFEPSTDGLAIAIAYFTPDVSRVVFGAFFDATPPAGASSAEAGIYIVDARTGAEIKRIDTGPCGAAVVAVSNRSAIVFTSSASTCVTFRGASTRRDLSLESIDLESGVRTTLTSAAWVNDEDAVSADGSTIVFNEIDPASTPEHFRVPTVVLRPAVGQRVELPLGDFSLVHDVSGDGSRVLVDVNGSLEVWGLDVDDLADVGLDAENPAGERRPISQFAPNPQTHDFFAQFSPDGRTVFSAGSDGLLHEWDAESGDEIFNYPAPQGRPSISNDGLVLVPSLGGETTALLIDTSLRGEIAAIDTVSLAASGQPSGGCSGGELASVEAGGGYVAVTDWCGEEGLPESQTTTILSAGSLNAERSLPRELGVSLSPDGTRLAHSKATVDDGESRIGPIAIADVATGNHLFDLEGVCSFVRIGNLQELRQARREHFHEGCTDFPNVPFAVDLAVEGGRLRWSPDGSMVAAVDGIDGYFAVWDATDGSLLDGSLSANQAGQAAFDVAFSPDSTQLFVSYTGQLGSGQYSHSLASFSVPDWMLQATRDLPTTYATLELAGTSADGSALIGLTGVQGPERAIHWFETGTLNELRPARTRLHDSLLSAVAMNTDRSVLATGAVDGSIRLSNTVDGTLVDEIDFPGIPVVGLAFLSDSHLGIVLEDGNLRVVTIDPDELLEIALNSLTRSYTQDECDRYNFDPCPTLEQIRGGRISSN